MGDSDSLHDNWEIRVKTPAPDSMAEQENMRLSPRVAGAREEDSGETINMDECWTINIKVGQ